MTAHDQGVVVVAEPRRRDEPAGALALDILCALELVSRDSEAGDAFSRSRVHAPIVVGFTSRYAAHVGSTSRSAQRRVEARGTRNVLWPSSAP